MNVVVERIQAYLDDDHIKGTLTGIQLFTDWATAVTVVP